MKALRVAALLIAAGVCSSLALAQGGTASVIDLTTNTVVSRFFSGTDSACVNWGSNSVAYVMQEEGLVKYDMTVSPPNPVYQFEGVGGKFAVNPANTRVLLSEFLLDVSSTPFTVLFGTPDIPQANDMAFYSAGTRAVMVDSTTFYVLDLTVSPPTNTSVTLPDDGLVVRVNPAGTRAVVTLDDNGGLQVVDLTVSPPVLIGTPVGPLSPADPQGVAIIPNGTRAIYVDESNPTAEANVIDITAAPSLVNTVPITLLTELSAVVVNPVTAQILIRGDEGVGIMSAPYTSLGTVITDPGFTGGTTYGLAVNPAGTRAIVLNEDSPASFGVPTLSPWMLALLALALGSAGFLLLTRRA